MIERKVKPIKNGTVLDHLPPKSALKILKVLDLDFESPVEILINTTSKSKGNKDIIFIENKTLNQKEIEKIGLLAENSTWNIIENETVKEKNKILLPKEANNLIHCKNKNCITNFEEIPTKFAITKEGVICNYCNREIPKESLGEQLK